MSQRVKIGLVLLVMCIVIIAGIALYIDWFGIGGIQSGDAIAPTLATSLDEQIVYRIDTTQSSVQYEVNEIFAGRNTSTAIGITEQIAGDILLDTGDYTQSEVGTIVINIEQFESDSDLRDRRIRQEFLESEQYPEAIFVTSELLNFPGAIVEGESYGFQMVGDLTIKETTQSEQWDVTASLAGEQLTGTAITTILMSDYDIGPIEIIGLVETSNEVLLTFDFVAILVADETETSVEAETSGSN